MQAIYMMCLNLIKQYSDGKLDNPKVKFDSYYKNRRLTKVEYDALLVKLEEVEASKAQAEQVETPVEE